MSKLRLMSKSRSKLFRGDLDILSCKISGSYVEKRQSYGHLKFLTSEAEVEVKFEVDFKNKVKPIWGRSRTTSM